LILSVFIMTREKTEEKKKKKKKKKKKLKMLFAISHRLWSSF